MLVSLKASLSPSPAPPLASWTEANSDCNTWLGVACDIDGFVVALNLPSSNLNGVMPFNIQDLTHLVTLDLSNNPLTGPVPFFNLSTLPSLVYLDLSSCNGLTGNFTSTLGFPQLEYLSLRNSLLLGPLPESLGSIRTLKHLDLTSAFDAGPRGRIPTNFQALTNLEYLSLASVGLQGPVPPVFGGMIGLTYLDLSSNYLGGDLTTPLQQLGKIATLGYLNISLQTTEAGGPAAFDGHLPADMGANWVNLTALDLQGCGLQGQLSASIGNMSNLQILNMQSCRLSGTLPKALVNCSSLVQLLLANNSFTGAMPVGKVNRLTQLLSMDVSSNKFVGELPDFTCIGHAVQNVNFSNNYFRSLVPESWGRTLKNLTSIDVHSNYLFGRLTTLTFLTKLAYLDVSNNQLSGPLPSGWLSAAALTAPGPTGQAQQGRFDVSSNFFWGTPSILSGAISALPMDAPATVRLNCFANTTQQRSTAACKGFCNAAPSGGCAGIESCILLPGRAAPACMTLAAVGLNATYGITSPPPPAPLVQAAVPAPQSHSVSPAAIASIAVGGAIACALLVALGVLLCARRRGRFLDDAENVKTVELNSEGSSRSWDPSIRQCRHLDIVEIHKATNFFSDSNRLKAGGFGTVYKGLAPDGKLWAVKRNHSITAQSRKDFENEIKIISKVSHKNLVELLGHCQNDHEQILVYEYVPNGNLRQQLDCDPVYGGVPLTFDQRLEIAVGAARGIRYLHIFAKEPVIHRDIKPANLVLDKRLEVKVADFGLSRALVHGADGTDGPDAQQLSTQMTGTPGYLDPDYYRTFKVTTKSDVFSFGVVLFELITGRTAVMKDPASLDSIALVRWAHPYVANGNVAAIVDPNMGTYSKEAMDLFCAVALLCVDPRRDHRPTMLQVVRRLEEAQGVTLKLPPSSSMATPADLWTGVVIPGLPCFDSDRSSPDLGSTTHSEGSSSGDGNLEHARLSSE